MSLYLTQIFDTNQRLRIQKTLNIPKDSIQKLRTMLTLLRNLNGEGDRKANLMQNSLFFEFDVFPVSL